MRPATRRLDHAPSGIAGAGMEIVYFTIVAVALYVAADWILDRVEQWRGQRLRYRSILFFFILATLALASFTLLQRWTAP